MIYAPEMLDILQTAAVSEWRGIVYRHMFGSHPPARSNITGARWNEPSVAAIYTSCERETALAEAEFYISLQPLRPRTTRTLYTLSVALRNVIDLTAADRLSQLGITADVLSSLNQTRCRMIGGAVNWLGHHGLLVPSARRAGGTNLVIFGQDPPVEAFSVVAEEVLSADPRT